MRVQGPDSLTGVPRPLESIPIPFTFFENSRMNPHSIEMELNWILVNYELNWTELYTQ